MRESDWKTTPAFVRKLAIMKGIMVAKPAYPHCGTMDATYPSKVFVSFPPLYFDYDIVLIIASYLFIFSFNHFGRDT